MDGKTDIYIEEVKKNVDIITLLLIQTQEQQESGIG